MNENWHNCLEKSRVVDSRMKNNTRWRSRRCLICRKQWQTYEISQKTLERLEFLVENSREIVEFGLLEMK